MFCQSCGGEYADWVQKCPYCGSVNERADEKLYLQHLENVRQRLNMVDRESEVIYRRNVGGTVKKLMKKVLILVAVVVGLTVFFAVRSSINDRKMEEFSLRRLEWEQQEFPKLDEWYAAGEYDRIVEENRSLVTGGKSEFSLYNWRHYYYICEFYADYAAIQKAYEPGLDGGILGSAMYAALRLKYNTSEEYLNRLQESYRANGAHGISPEEAELVRSYRPAADELFYGFLGWSESEMDAFYKECSSGDYFRVVPCYNRAEQIAKEMNGQ